MLNKRSKKTPVTKPSRLDISSETRSDVTKVHRRGHNRLPKLLDEAARVFAKRGFAAASIREIVEPVGMLPGSLYYHFATKEALLVAVYREGIERISAKVDAAIDGVDDPWSRLEAACIGHLSALLDRTDYSQVVVRIRPDDVPSVATELTILRNSYEHRFEALLEMIALPKSVERRDLRLLLMGALNWSQTWFREGGVLTPGEIAKRFIALLKMNLLKP
jgi:AcrR family transcriptional regulator